MSEESKNQPDEVISTTRKFAAIMFTDIAGYTALMGSDEDKAFEILRKNKKIHEDLVGKFNGTLVKEMGDGMLISFDLASDAVRCAMEIQEACKKQEIPLKIGIHEGETVFSGKDVHGDGVNVASRLEAATEVGGISISGKVYSDIKNINDINTRYLGQKRFKNVDEPIGVYNVLSDGEQITESKRKRGIKPVIYIFLGLIVIIVALWILEIGPFEPKYERSIAVMPFESENSDIQNAYFTNGMTEGVHAGLSKIANFHLVSLTSTDSYQDTTLTPSQIADTLQVKFILKGTINKIAELDQIEVNLFEAETGKVIWSESYNIDQEGGDIFEIQRDISFSIAKKLKATISEEEKKLITSIPTQDQDAYRDYLRGREYAKKGGQSNVNTARFFYERAIAKDPDFALAHSWLGFTYFYQSRQYQASEDNFGDTIKHFGDKAIEIDPDVADAHLLLAHYYLYLKNDRLNSITEATIASELNPNSADAYALLGTGYTADQQYVDALINLNKARKLLIGDIDQSNSILDQYANCYMAFNDYDRLIEVCQESVEYSPLDGYYRLATSSLMYGDWDQAKTYMDKLCAIDSGWWCTQQRVLYYSCTGDFDKFLIPEDEPGHIDWIEENWLGYIISHIEGREGAEDFINRGKEIWEGVIRNERWNEPQANYELAAVSAFLGKKEATFKILHRMEEDFFYGGFLRFMQFDPRFDGIREEEEFKQIIARNEEKYADIRAELDSLRAKGVL